jgi:GNAT superfamily N-acetyltransferase
VSGDTRTDIAWEFEVELQDRCAQRSERFAFGTALFQPDLPLVYDENFLRLERRFDDLDAESLAGEAERLQGQAKLIHRKAVVPDERAGERLSAGLARLGWRRSILVTMAHAAERPDHVAHRVQELDSAAVRQSRSRALWEGLSSDPAGSQVVRHLELLAQAVPTRLFGIEVEGEVAAWCVLYEEGGVGQIDDVVTLREHRRKGYGRAVVQAALGASLDAGNHLTFLVADDEDWPKQMYAALGFEPVGRRYEFTRT